MPRWGRRQHGITSNHQSLLQCSEQRPDVMRIPCRLKTAFGHGAPNLEKHRRIFFFIFFSGGICKNGICIYIWLYTLYVLSTVSIYTSCFFLFNHPRTGFATMVLQLPDTGRELDGIQPSRSKTVQLEAPLGVAWGEQCSKPWFVNWGVLPKQW